MATTPVAPATPAPAPTRTTPLPAPAPIVPTTLSPVTRRRPARTAPPARMAYTRHATAGDNDDRILNPEWYRFLIVMLVIGGMSFFSWVIFGSFQWGKAVAPAGSTSLPTVVERHTERVIVERPAPVPSRELTPEERAEQYKEERRRQYGIR